ncbi:hypothetical protein CYMTET_16769 [Cymbomonas tetramitiformis]|uniref:MIB/HERC2 domain-containing protein n=1 Tax=Cymbomonas tetramitiformis TaxID=36881 RepID=A0AAE0GBA2_9CHLO|nr:hypothetical protein CYMTET_16769 [Cymbomonas tetramitiformis]
MRRQLAVHQVTAFVVSPVGVRSARRWVLRRQLVTMDPAEADEAARQANAAVPGGAARAQGLQSLGANDAGVMAGGFAAAFLALLACSFDTVVCGAGSEDGSPAPPAAAMLALGQVCKSCMLALKQEPAWQPALDGVCARAFPKLLARQEGDDRSDDALRLFTVLTILGGFMDGLHPGSPIRYLKRGDAFVMTRPAGVLATITPTYNGEERVELLAGNQWHTATSQAVQLDTTVCYAPPGEGDAAWVAALMPVVKESLGFLATPQRLEGGWRGLHRAVRVLQMVKNQVRHPPSEPAGSAVSVLSGAGAVEGLLDLAGSLWGEPGWALAERLEGVRGSTKPGAVGRRGLTDFFEARHQGAYYGPRGRIEHGWREGLERLLGALQAAVGKLLPPAVAQAAARQGLPGAEGATTPAAEACGVLSASGWSSEVELPPIPGEVGHRRCATVTTSAANGSDCSWEKLWSKLPNDLSGHIRTERRGQAGEAHSSDASAAAELQATYMLWGRLCALSVSLEVVCQWGAHRGEGVVTAQDAARIFKLLLALSNLFSALDHPVTLPVQGVWEVCCLHTWSREAGVRLVGDAVHLLFCTEASPGAHEQKALQFQLAVQVLYGAVHSAANHALHDAVFRQEVYSKMILAAQVQDGENRNQMLLLLASMTELMLDHSQDLALNFDHALCSLQTLLDEVADNDVWPNHDLPWNQTPTIQTLSHLIMITRMMVEREQEKVDLDSKPAQMRLGASSEIVLQPGARARTRSGAGSWGCARLSGSPLDATYSFVELQLGEGDDPGEARAEEVWMKLGVAEGPVQLETAFAEPGRKVGEEGAPAGALTVCYGEGAEGSTLARVLLQFSRGSRSVEAQAPEGDTQSEDSESPETAAATPVPDTAPDPRVNDEGAPVALGNGRFASMGFDGSNLYFCGRHLGHDAIPGSDGDCGPCGGPQCASCRRYQALADTRNTAAATPVPDPAPDPRVNDEGAPVALGNGRFAGMGFDGSDLYFCGRHLGCDAIPGSDGDCGPSGGPQCASCRRYQALADTRTGGLRGLALRVKGARVKRGKDWSWGNQDGGAGQLGTVQGLKGPRILVKWDSGNVGCYHHGGGAKHLELVSAGPIMREGAQVVNLENLVRGVITMDADLGLLVKWQDEHARASFSQSFLQVALTIEAISSGEIPMAVGAKVERGPSWAWGSQDGGDRGKGTVQEVQDDGWVNVLWDTGESNVYRWGVDCNYDLAVVERGASRRVGGYLEVSGTTQLEVNGIYSLHSLRDGKPVYAHCCGARVFFDQCWKLSPSGVEGEWRYSATRAHGAHGEGPRSPECEPPAGKWVCRDPADSRPTVRCYVHVSSTRAAPVERPLTAQSAADHESLQVDGTHPPSTAASAPARAPRVACFTTSTEMTQIYNDAGSGAHVDVSVWRPQLQDGQVLLGDLVKAEHDAPADSIAVGIETPGGTAFARPESYTLHWRQSRGHQSLWVWTPVPPEGYVALGFVCTTSPEAPEVGLMRCVAERFATEAEATVQIWNDAGSGGGTMGPSGSSRT